jgi:hypothetical protein
VEFLNPWMLSALGGLAVPILVHLLSRRKQELVDWGAMRFLEPSPKERRSLWLENLWLLLIRLGLFAALALALARPWFQSTWLAAWTSTRPQDVALVVDGSYSLERAVGNRVVGDEVRRLAREVLDELDRFDTLQVYEARETPRPRLPGYVRDRAAARESILDLPPATGASNLPGALIAAARDLLQTGQLDREIVVLTDGQRYPWKLEEPGLWQTWSGLRQQAKLPPRVWVIETPPDPTPRSNVAVGPLELSRQLALPGSDVRLRAKLTAREAEAPLTRTVRLEINGLPSPEHVATVRVPGGGATVAEFDLRPTRTGCQTLKVFIDEADALAADNAAHAVLEVGGGWPVLLVDGAPDADPTQSETYYLNAAFDAGPQGWLRPTRVTLDTWDASQLADYSAIVLANVAALNETQLTALTTFMQAGGAVVVTLGDQQRPTPTQELLPWEQWLPVTLTQRIHAAPGDQPPNETTIVAESLELPWQARFRKQRTQGFCDVRYRAWWQVQPTQPVNAKPTVPQVVARFATGDPALVWQRRGDGGLAVWTATIDGDGNGLTAKPDYVAWWHEVIFALLEPNTDRNLPVGANLTVTAPFGSPPLDGAFLGPWNLHGSGDAWAMGRRQGRRWPNAPDPGLYAFIPERLLADGGHRDLQRFLAEGVRDAYALSADLAESDLTPLTDDDRRQLTETHGLRFLKTPAELQPEWVGNAGRTELATALLYALVGLLAIETWLTSRMMSRGQGPARSE